MLHFSFKSALCALVVGLACVSPGRAGAEPDLLLADPAARVVLDEGRVHMLSFRLGQAEARFRKVAAARTGGPAA